MIKLIVFNSVSLDGYFTDAKGDMSWAHKSDPEWTAFSADNAKDPEGTLLFGRVTYEMMASYWPTPRAKQDMPVVARTMNAKSKVVFSRTLSEVSWSNTRLVKTGMIEEVRRLKHQDSGKAIVLMGSGSIVSQLTAAGLIDEYQIVVTPLVLGKGRTMFEGIEDRLALKLTGSRPFANGNVVLHYERG